MPTFNNVSDAISKLADFSKNYKDELANFNTINARYTEYIGTNGFTGPFPSSTYSNSLALFGATSWSGPSGSASCTAYCAQTRQCVGTVYAYSDNVYPNSCTLIGTTGANTPAGYLPNGGITGTTTDSTVTIQNMQYQHDLANYSNQLLQKYSSDINACLTYIKTGRGGSYELYNSLRQKYSALLRQQNEINGTVENDANLYANSKIEITREQSNYVVYVILACVIFACIANLYLFPDNNLILIAIVFISITYIIVHVYFFNIQVFKLPNIDWSYYSRVGLNYYN